MNLVREWSRAPSVLLKAAMAVSGFLMAGWLTLHMLGNLLVFAGAAAMNAYGEKLRATGLLWPMRLLLFSALLIHVVCAALTTARAHAARPIAYRVAHKPVGSTLASRTMRIGGVIVLLFLVYHVAAIYGVAHPAFVPDDVHHNLIALLRMPVHAFVYLVATALVALHLAHGLTSALISLGWANWRERSIRRAMRAWVVLVTLGFAAPCLAISLAWV
ncbi:MAG TPA: succinate dehydrogenase cytochrome b subunit [Polyangiales bacterium]|jgi:succinate dehydrogenase / fumarate reductase cytochrome b subunit